MDPNNSDNLVELALFYRLKGLYESTVKVLTKAIEIDPLDIDYYYLTAQAFFLLGQHLPAETYFLKGLEIDPDNSMLRFMLACL